MPSRRAIVGGIAGVGKTTVLNEATAILKKRGVSFDVLVYGTVMLEEAKRIGINDRDEMRKQPYEVQLELQRKAAMRIAGSAAEVVLIDTHYHIPTPFGLLPGIPVEVAQIIRPTHLALIYADPQEIVERRAQDKTRKREEISVDEVVYEINYSRYFMAALSTITGAMIVEVKNATGRSREAAEELIAKLGVM